MPPATSPARTKTKTMPMTAVSVADLRGRSKDPEHETLLGRVDLDRVAVVDLAGQELHRQGVLDLALDQALQGTGPERRVESLVGEPHARRIRQGERELATGQSRLQHLKLDLDDLRDLVAAEGVEHDDLVDPVDEFRAEVIAHV